MGIRAGVIVVSDGCFHGKREDTSGMFIMDELKQKCAAEVEYAVVPDESALIREALLRMTDDMLLEIIITTGGTGFGPRDVTPEVMGEILEKEAPAIPAALLVNGLQSTPRAMLSRGRAGIRKKSLIINLPGSRRGVEDGMKILLPVIPHALEMMRGGGH